MALDLEPPSPFLTVEEYLDLEARSDRKHEYVAGEIFLMAGASRNHNTIAGNILALLWNAARGSGCSVFGSDMLLRAAPDLYYYPDVQVVCGDDGGTDRYTVGPCVVVEVLSPSTRREDLREKARAYRSISSVQAYVAIDSEKRHVVRYHHDQHGNWDIARLTSDGVVPFPCPAVTLTIDQIYEGVTF